MLVSRESRFVFSWKASAWKYLSILICLSYFTEKWWWLIVCFRQIKKKHIKYINPYANQWPPPKLWRNCPASFEFRWDLVVPTTWIKDFLSGTFLSPLDHMPSARELVPIDGQNMMLEIHDHTSLCCNNGDTNSLDLTKNMEIYGGGFWNNSYSLRKTNSSCQVTLETWNTNVAPTDHWSRLNACPWDPSAANKSNGDAIHTFASTCFV